MKNYSLAVRGVENVDEFQRLSDSIDEFDLTRYVFDTGAFFQKEHEAIFSTWEAQEWCSHEGQMLILSEKYPKLTFELTCQEEDNFWRVYYKDGQTEECVGCVVFEQPKNIQWDSLLAF